jgi:hypothetical protein
MTDIVIFQAPDEDNRPIKSERELMYDYFIKNENIPAHHFSSLMEMEDDEYVGNIKTNIPSLLLKQTFEYVKPIIKEIPLMYTNAAVIEKKTFKKNKKYQEAEVVYYYILTQVANPIECIIISKNFYKIKTIIVPSNTPFKVIGVKVPTILYKNINKYLYSRMRNISILSTLSSGSYGVKDFVSDIFTQLYTDPLTSVSKKIIFADNADAVLHINKINNFIDYTSNFYRTNVDMLYQYLNKAIYRKYMKDITKSYNIGCTNYFKRIDIVKNNDIYDKLKEVYTGEFNFMNYTSNYFILINNNLFNIFNKISMFGVNSNKSKTIMQDLYLKKEYDNSFLKQKKKKSERTLMTARKKAIALDKFGITKLSLLNSSQIKYVEIEYKKIDINQDSKNDNIPEIDIANSIIYDLENSITHRLKNSIKLIESYIKIPSILHNYGKIIQNKKKIDIICPHVIDKSLLVLNINRIPVSILDDHKPPKSKKSFPNIKTVIDNKYNDIKNHLINNYAATIDHDDEDYHCKICGEILYITENDFLPDFIAGKKMSYIPESDRLKSRIWKDVAYIVNRMILFKDKTDLKTIINTVTDVLRPKIGEVEILMSKIKTNSSDALYILIDVYISIYIYAFFIHLIYTNYGKITFAVRMKNGGAYNANDRKKSTDSSMNGLTYKKNTEYTNCITKTNNKIGGKKNIEQIRLQHIFNNALSLLLYTKNSQINNLSSINVNSVKDILLQSYKWVKSLKTETIKKIDNDTKADFKYDIIFNYIKYIHNMKYYNTIKNVKNKQDTPEYTPEQILGRSIDNIKSDIANNIGIYSTIVIPESWCLDKTSEDNHTYCNYVYNSALSVLEYAKEKIHTRNAVPCSSYVAIYNKKYEYLRQISKEVHYRNIIAGIDPYNKLKLLKNPPCDNFINIKLEHYYDNDGVKHKFDIFVYQKVNEKNVFVGTKYEYNKIDITDWISSNNISKINNFSNMHIVDEKCSICNQYKSRVKNINIASKLEYNNNINLFFIYFESRCPKGLLHDISNSGGSLHSCTKCGFTDKIRTSHDIKYYNKYKSVFKTIHEKILKLEKTNFIKIFNTGITKDLEIKVYPIWKINNSHIVDLSKKMGINYNMLINLGLSEGRKFAKIKSGLYNPSLTLPDENKLTQILYLTDYYYYIIQIYYTIKYNELLTKIPFNLTLILKKNKIPNLNKVLPNINKDISNQINYYRYKLPIKGLVNFILSSICTTVLDIKKIFDNNKINVSSELIMFMLDKVLGFEKSVSEPEPENFIFDKSADVDLNIPADQNYTDESGDNYESAESSIQDSPAELSELEDVVEDDFSMKDIDMYVEDE